ncbi:Uncharacterised protein [Yersinia similis]|uniref:Uncharacterized protein n=1 Tax=Yersinia similis TaxID=367190 RepID=A0A0T9QAC6_9GAMM|nr:Uncharacterised protein [Yersinia similis]
MLAGHLITDINVRLLANPDDAILNGEDSQKSKRQRQGWRGSSLHGCIYGVFTICLFFPLQALCK